MYIPLSFVPHIWDNLCITNNTQTQINDFYGLGIAPKLLEALEQLKFKTPTPIQQKSIPVAAAGSDMVGIAQTGTGKTIAFAIPMIQRLVALDGKGLILVPTRELAIQVADVIKQFGPGMGLGSATIIGGENPKRQLDELRKNPRIIVATPGRLIDHLSRRSIDLSDVRILVLDEADRMFDMGFAPQIERVIAVIPRERQTMLFSATMPDAIMKLASAHMKLPVRIETSRPGTAAEKVEQELFIVERADKPALLAKLLDKYWGSVLLFVRTKHNAKKIARSIREIPHAVAEIHSNRSLNQRKDALEGFKSGKYRILVATDIAARGIDVTGIELVINYDLPDEHEIYVHRIGRTGRAGKPGRAITFASPDQGSDVKSIERLIRMPLTVAKHPDIREAQFGTPSGPRQPGEKRRPGTENVVRNRAFPLHKPKPVRGRERPGGFASRRNKPGGGSSRHSFSRSYGVRGNNFKDAKDNRRGGPSRYGVRASGGRNSIVSPSAYFEEPRRAPHNRQYSPERSAGTNKPASSGGWLGRLFKKKKEDE
ncbi:MAG: hypothetical protein COT17_04845 [Elusimicrobia bacterium CG08_land_8_20_14_0_20_51_18]|nr:MAG: hypothetical protein COT17_04845 [Elusimicrobia bacterium CG08_land_8_20_14_0_20_51_18]